MRVGGPPLHSQSSLLRDADQSGVVTKQATADSKPEASLVMRRFTREVLCTDLLHQMKPTIPRWLTATHNRNAELLVTIGKVLVDSN